MTPMLRGPPPPVPAVAFRVCPAPVVSCEKGRWGTYREVVAWHTVRAPGGVGRAA